MSVHAYLKRAWPLYAMILPGVIFILLFRYYPMYGIVIAFQDFSPAKGFANSPWVGWENFEFLFSLPEFGRFLGNTVLIAVVKIVADQVGAIALALLLNEARILLFRRTIQTLIYLPYFLSWIVLGGILLDILAPHGILNQAIGNFGIQPQLFLGSNDWFRGTIILSGFWKNVGFSTIIYLAALTAINPTLHEAAAIDGAGRFRRIWHITLPGIRPTIVLLAALSLGDVLDAGFEQILTLYSPTVYRTGDIIDTYVYRVGLVSAQYSLAGAVGLFKSLISFFLIVLSYYLADRFAGYRIL
ncbi:MAG: ABC transporter permease subunit [Chloroflexi bacterium]|nr:ABC transporter permease subunit [Chloroflexota bacterium]MCY4246898.1 ABC transporter permease subunit [Chloroflexota bacterium]